MNPRDPLSEFEELLMAYADGELTPDQWRHLMDLIKDDPAARDDYLEYLVLDSLLSWERSPVAGAYGGTIGSLRSDEPGQVPGRPSWSRRMMRFLLTVCAVVLLSFVGVGAFLHWRGLGRSIAPVPIAYLDGAQFGGCPLSGGVAVLTRAVKVVWEPLSPTHDVGAILATGPLKIRSGILQIEFYTGATIVLEGPAEIELKASDRAYCRRGKLRAFVPPQARGFRIDSPRGHLVDLGTECGMWVDPNRGAEVYVFDGKVEIQETLPEGGTDSKRELTRGKGIRIGNTGGVTALLGDPPAFTSLQELEKRDLEQLKRRFGAWLVDSRHRQADPRIVANFPFEGRRAGTRSLTNVGSREGLDGAIVGCAWVTGRWPHKGALEFKRPSDRVLIHVPGTFDSLTLMAWVRVDALPQPLNALMLSQVLSNQSEPGAVHWQITRSGKLSLGVHHVSLKKGYSWTDYMSSPIFGPEHLGRWTQLVAVYDSRVGAVIHYVNGLEVSRRAIVKHVPLRIGEAELGNLSAPLSGDPMPIRNLSGRIDEFIVFDTALDPREIYQSYLQGSPRLVANSS